MAIMVVGGVSCSEQHFNEGSELPAILSAADLRALIQQKKMALRKLDRLVTALQQTKHSSASGQQLQCSVTDLDRDLTDLADVLDDRTRQQTSDGEKGGLLNELRDDSDRLTARLDRVSRKLGEDIAAARYQETKDAKDVIKVMMYVGGLPAIAANLMKIFFGEKSHAIPFAAGAALITGVWTAFPKEAKQLWKAGSETVCNGPQIVKNSFVVYFVASEVKEKARAIKGAFTSNAQAIAYRTSRILSEVRQTTQRFLNPPKASL